MTDIFQIVENNGTPKDIGDSKARANIGEPFSVSKNYAIGDECLYEGILYKFTSNHNSESWNSEHVTSINLANDKVNKSGDTITGATYFIGDFGRKSTVADNTASSIASDQYLIHGFFDKNNLLTSYLQGRQSTNGTCSLDVMARHYVNGANVDNGFTLNVDKDGDCSITFTDVSKWRGALGLGETSGAVPIANGGTSATTAADARTNLGLNWIFAGTVTGTDTVTVPESATEVMAIVTLFNAATFNNTIVRSALRSVWYMGGYYYNSTDYAIVNLNVSNSSKTFQLRYVTTGNGIDNKSSSTLTVYYK